MESLVRQLLGIWNEISLGNRLVLLAVVAASAGWLGMTVIDGEQHNSDGVGRTLLLGGRQFSDSEQAAALKAFSSNSSLRGYEIVGRCISVPKSQESAYLAQLAKNDAFPGGMLSAFRQALDKGNWWDSPIDRERRTQVALMDEIGKMISSSSPKIEFAHVIIAQDQNKGLRQKSPSKAAVQIKTNDRQPLSAREEQDIRHIVASAVPALSVDEVMIRVNDSQSKMLGTQDMLDAMLANNGHMQAIVGYEQLFEQKIRKALGNLPGLDIAVNVIVDEYRKKESYDELHSKGPTRRNDTSSKTIESSTPVRSNEPGARPNVDPPAVAVNQGAILSTNNSNAETSKTEMDNNRTHILKDSQPFTPLSTGVTITVPKQYLADPANPNAQPGWTLDLITKSVLALNLNGLTPEKLHVQVSNMDVPKEPDVVSASPPIMKLVTTYLPTALMVTGSLVAILSAVVIARRASPTPVVIERPAAAPTATAKEITEAMSSVEIELPSDVTKEQLERSKKLEESVKQIVKENPDVAAGILGRWINAATT